MNYKKKLIEVFANDIFKKFDVQKDAKVVINEIEKDIYHCFLDTSERDVTGMIIIDINLSYLYEKNLDYNSLLEEYKKGKRTGYITYQNNNPKINCPNCGSEELWEYLYGEPTYDYDREKYVLGGCEITLDNPKYKCKQCGKDVLVDVKFKWINSEESYHNIYFIN